MSKKLYLYWFDVGPTHGIVFNIPLKDQSARLARVDFMNGYHVVATDDTVAWGMRIEQSVTESGRWVPIRAHIPEETGNLSYVEGAVRKGGIPMRTQMLYEWARKKAASFIKEHGEDAVGKTSSAMTAAVNETRSIPDLHGNLVQYYGWEKMSKTSAHSIGDLHEAVVRAVDQAHRVWGWKGTGISIQFNDSSKCMGQAWSPGSGSETGERRIALITKLLREYNAHSVYRVILHELCHHAREEQHPRSARERASDGHDRLFKSMLRAADPESVNASAQFFEDAPDPALLAKTLEKGNGAVFDPTRGFFQGIKLKSRQLRLVWHNEPFKGDWKPVSFKVCDAEVLYLLKKFAPSDWKNARVIESDSWRQPPQTLDDIVRWLLAGYPLQMGKTIEFLTAIMKATS